MNMSDIIDLSDSLKSVNFGDGIELLMNQKTKDKGNSKSDIHIDDLSNLEEELNKLVDDPFTTPSTPTNIDIKFDDFNNSTPSLGSVKFADDLGKDTANVESKTKSTWDGYQTFSSIPINTEKTPPPSLSKDDIIREKFKYLRKLESLEKKGVNLTKKYSLDSSLSEMTAEYDMIAEESKKTSAVKFQNQMLMACINGIEFLNSKFDPFDIKLDGWSDQINENITDYDDVFSELYEKYKSRPSIAPELKLLFQLGGSAMMVHMTNTMFKTEVPGIDDIFKQNPDLMQHFKNAAVNSMSNTNPGFSGFMNNIVNQKTTPSPNNNQPPPQPIATQDFNSYNYDSSNRPGNNSSVKRAEMKGPTDITQILSNLKTKSVHVSQQQEPQQAPQQSRNMQQIFNDSSTISISDMKELQSSGSVPKKSKRRQSEKNSISLDI
jgi:hypothetical protein